MNFGQSFRLALKSLVTSKMRSLLTMLGIIIGVAAVIVITSLGNGMQNLMNRQFEQLGANLIQVMLYTDGSGSRSVEPNDMYALVEQYPQYLSGVSPYVSPRSAIIRNGDNEYKRTNIYGVSEIFYYAGRNQLMSGEKLAQGRFLSYADVERRQKVCIIGDYLARTAFAGNALGKTLSIQGVPFTVIGVLTKYADSTEGSKDDVFYLPYPCAQELNRSSQVSLYLFSSQSKETSAAAKGIIENRLFRTFQDSKYYYVQSSAEMMDAFNTIIGAMMAVLVAIAAISLLVGGIGIMNIMLVSVTERTREIGIRKSLGAKRRDIRSQFIIEAGTTSAIGGMLGILFGMGLAHLIGPIIGSMLAAEMGPDATFSAVPNLMSVGIAFGVSVSIGIFFGYLPANKAAKLNPIDALRYD